MDGHCLRYLKYYKNLEKGQMEPLFFMVCSVDVRPHTSNPWKDQA